MEYRRYNNRIKNNNYQLRQDLPTIAVYHTIFEWLIEAGVKTYDEVVKDASSWGNCGNGYHCMLKTTGSSDEYGVFNIYDLSGNCREWVFEQNYDYGYLAPVSYTSGYSNDGDETGLPLGAIHLAPGYGHDISFRCVMWKASYPLYD